MRTHKLLGQCQVPGSRKHLLLLLLAYPLGGHHCWVHIAEVHPFTCYRTCVSLSYEIFGARSAWHDRLAALWHIYTVMCTYICSNVS
jgi:hypothetical protein